jgi:hypothetical protein
MAAMLCLAGMTRDAGATVTIALEWGVCGGGSGCTGGVGTSSITVNPGGGQTLRLDIFLSQNEPGGIKGHGFSLNFDTDGLNELNVGAMAGVEWSGTDGDPTMAGSSLYQPISSGSIPATPDSSAGVTGRLNLFESGSLGIPLRENGVAYTVGTVTATAPARYRVGQVFFVVNAGVATDGDDVFSGLFNLPFDAILDSSGLVVLPAGSLNFGTASLNVVPEPGTVSLLGLGLIGLVVAGRRSRRS